MTLNLRNYLKNLVDKEAKISHFTMTVAFGEVSNLADNVASEIRTQFGAKFLDDADYVGVFTRTEGWNDTDIKTLFDLVNRALGNGANNMNKSDFKTIASKEAEAPGTAVILKITLK